jgi:hypothetical protein
MIAALLPEKVICVAKRGDDVVYSLFSEEEAAVGKASVGLRPRRGAGRRDSSAKLWTTQNIIKLPYVDIQSFITPACAEPICVLPAEVLGRDHARRPQAVLRPLADKSLACACADCCPHDTGTEMPSLTQGGRIANSSATRSRRLAPSEAESINRKGNSYGHTIRAAHARCRCGRRQGAASSPA